MPPSHSKTFRNHEEAKKVVCVLCFRKASNCRKMSQRLINLVKIFIIDYTSDHLSYPSGLCSTCKIKLDKGTVINNVINYEERQIEKNVNDMGMCVCDICAVARSNSYEYQKDPSLKKNKAGRPSTSSPKKNMTVCSKCMSEVGKGVPHVCTSRNKIENILKVSGNQKEQVASRVLADISNTMPSTSSAQNAPILTLKRDRGVPMNVVIPNKKARLALENPPIVDVHVLKEIQIENGQNMTQIQRTARTLRKSKVNVKFGAVTELQKQSHDLDEYFSVESVAIDVSKNLKKLKSVVYCSDLNGLVTHLLNKRNMNDSEFLCKIGVDGGGGSLKVAKLFFLLTVF